MITHHDWGRPRNTNMIENWLKKIRKIFNPSLRHSATVQEEFTNELCSSQDTAAEFAIPIFCYHSLDKNGATYETNNHLALAQDLKLFAKRGYQVLPLTTLVDVLRGVLPYTTVTGKKLVSLSFDDGSNFDYYDYEDKNWGHGESFHTILKDSEGSLIQAFEGPRAVAFVIASPEARAILDHTCANGQNEWTDEWWAPCAEGNIIGIANHSWDHVHDTLPTVRQEENKKASFFDVKTFEDAEAQIADAQHYISEKTGGRNLPFFGYPYGHISPYLRDHYFPEHGARLGLHAAFGTDGGPVRKGCNIWSIPRFVCGAHWKTINEMEALLDAVERGER